MLFVLFVFFVVKLLAYIRRSVLTPRFGTRSLAYALAILLGWTLDISGALHVYGLSRLEGQQLAAATALLLVLVAAGWVHVAAKLGGPPPTPPTHNKRGGG